MNISNALSLQKARDVDKNPPFIGSTRGRSRLGGIQTANNLDLYLSWSWACIDTIAESLSALDMEVSLLKGKDREPAPDDHWLVDLLENPNPEIEASNLWSLATRWYLINGNAYLYMPTYGKEIPQEVWVLPSNRITVVPGAPGESLVRGYIFHHEGGQYAIPAEDVVHWKFLDPSQDITSTTLIGRSPINAAAPAIKVDIANQVYLSSYYENGAIPAYVITQSGPMDQFTFDMFADRWDAKFNNAKSAGRWGLLDGGKQIEVLNSGDQIKNAASLDEANRKRVCSVWRVPEMLITGDYNARAVSENVTENFHRNNVAPKARRLSQALTRRVRRFDPVGKPMVTVSDYKSNDPAERRADWLALHQMGYPLNRILEEAGMELLPETEEPNELKSTVGGAAGLANMQMLYSLGQISREAVLANATIVYGFTPKEAAQLFPPLEEKSEPAPVETPPEEAPAEDVDTDEDAPAEEDEEGEVDEEVEARYIAMALDRAAQYAYWKNYDDLASDTTDGLTGILAEAFEELSKDVIAALKEADTQKDVTYSGDLFDLDEWKEMLDDLTAAELKRLVRRVSEPAAKDANADPKRARPFGERLSELMKGSTSKITTALDTIKDDLEKLLQKNRRQPIEKVTQKILKKFEHYTKSGAERIARTTATFTTGAAQAASWDTLVENDNTILQIERLWLTQGDGKVRDTHARANGQVEDESGMFYVGAAVMRHPGDGYVAEEAVNCRCVTRPRIKRKPADGGGEGGNGTTDTGEEPVEEFDI